MKEFDKLVETIKILRSPKGCPWDRAQKISNYKKYLLEETYELVDEIDSKDAKATKEELGDLFLILIVIAEIFKEKGKFSLNEALDKINEKLIARHPHVFSSKKLKTAKEVLSYWINSKAKIKKRKTIKDRLPLVAPSLLLADIFFKEYNHIHERENTKVESKKTFNRIIKILKLCAKSKDKGRLLAEINFDICKLAFLYKLDLESLLRKKVFTEAKGALYK
ncbi:MAG: MazG nucleotide pyrophosphohydrolase domain-containing protein [Candidatus Omnitrophota bacterium]|nr:MazG nucleotide pyrophosphohydrolase domain-containing protein [Candidatus Omnitrophota bacterium]